MYVYTYVEEYIKSLYHCMDIRKPEQLNVPTIASKLGLNVCYGGISFRIGNHIMIKRSTRQREWQMFGHEVCHYLRHCGNQLKMHPLFLQLQESQANHFAYHFCVPTFMLDQFKEVSVDVVMEKFNVEEDFALRRLEMYERKMMNARVYTKAW